MICDAILHVNSAKQAEQHHHQYSFLGKPVLHVAGIPQRDCAKAVVHAFELQMSWSV